MIKEAVSTPRMPRNITVSLEHLSHQLKTQVKKTDGSYPPLIATDVKHVGFYPYGGHPWPSPFPVTIRPDTIMHNGQQKEGIRVDYYTDGDPHSASGIMYRESIVLVREGKKIAAFHAEESSDPHTTTHAVTSSDARFIHQAQALYDSVKTAVTASWEAVDDYSRVLSHMRGYHYPYPAAQMAATTRILRKISSLMEPPHDQTTTLNRRSAFNRAVHNIPLFRQRAA